jgi:hypothetical protein
VENEMCSECRRDFMMRCPSCNEALQRVVDGLYCISCGYLKRTVSEDTLAMTEVRKPTERFSNAYLKGKP